MGTVGFSTFVRQVIDAHRDWGESFRAQLSAHDKTGRAAHLDQAELLIGSWDHDVYCGALEADKQLPQHPKFDTQLKPYPEFDPRYGDQRDQFRIFNRDVKFNTGIVHDTFAPKLGPSTPESDISMAVKMAPHRLKALELSRAELSLEGFKGEAVAHETLLTYLGESQNPPDRTHALGQAALNALRGGYAMVLIGGVIDVFYLVAVLAADRDASYLWKIPAALGVIGLVGTFVAQMLGPFRKEWLKHSAYSDLAQQANAILSVDNDLAN